MIFVYRFLFWPIFLILFPYYLRRMLRRRGLEDHLHERLGRIVIKGKSPSKKRIWIQAVSVGEVHAIEPVIDRLCMRKDLEIVLTTTTSTAYKIAKERYAGRLLKVAFFPLDFWCFSASAWNRICPDLLIHMEGDLWPEHFHQASKRKVPIVLVNARLSDRSFKRYCLLKPLTPFLLGKLNAISASNEADYKRFLYLGVAPERLSYTGNLKFDVILEYLTTQEKQVLKAELGLARRPEEDQEPIIILGSSTWPGEEAFLIDVLKTAQKDGIACRLLLVPRHAERRAEIRTLCEASEKTFLFRTDVGNTQKSVDIYVADAMGELGRLTQVGTLAMVGKSFPPARGGQSPVEAAANGLPIVYGPDMSNFKQMCISLEKCGAAKRVHNYEEGKQVLMELLKDEATRNQMAQNAHQWHRDNQGATEHTLKVIEAFL